MRTLKFRVPALLLALGMLTLPATVFGEVQTQESAVYPAATQILKRMTDFLNGLKKFSVHTENTFEDLLDSGHRVDYDVSAILTVSRPNKLKSERKGAFTDQVFYYDGRKLTLYNPTDKVYATEPAPRTIEGLLEFVASSLGIIVPAADLLYHNAYELLMQDVTYGVVVEKTFINGVKCHHLVFGKPGVDFQVWVADGNQPLPMKYVVTDTGYPELLSITTVMSDWNLSPDINDGLFKFVAPKGVNRISFMPIQVENRSGR